MRAVFLFLEPGGNCARATEGVKEELVMKSRFSSTVIFLICTLFGFAVSIRAQDIVIGEFASLTGSEATFGINSSNGVELAKEEINNAGGVLGRKIKIIKG
jgi:ABC-type branched-subunit amino acid transport system substrate-binding protein